MADSFTGIGEVKRPIEVQVKDLQGQLKRLKNRMESFLKIDRGGPDAQFKPTPISSPTPILSSLEIISDTLFDCEKIVGEIENMEDKIESELQGPRDAKLPTGG